MGLLIDDIMIIDQKLEMIKDFTSIHDILFTITYVIVVKYIYLFLAAYYYTKKSDTP